MAGDATDATQSETPTTSAEASEVEVEVEVETELKFEAPRRWVMPRLDRLEGVGRVAARPRSPMSFASRRETPIERPTPG